MKTKTKVAAGVVGGVAAGAALGVLFAPKSGVEMRKALKSKLDELASKAKSINVKDVEKYINDKVDEIKKDLAELDKQKVKQDAIMQAKKIKKNAESLAKYAKKKGTDELATVADELRMKAIAVTEDVLSKLEQKK